MIKKSWVVSCLNFLVSIISVLILALFGCTPKTTTATTTTPTEGAVTAQQGVAIFPDKQLEEAMRNALHKPEGPIYISDLEAQTSLDLGFRVTMSDLTGIEHCVNLTYLNLSRNNISDIEPLASLTKLTSLYVEQNNISDISPFASLTNLTVLYLETNHISDITPLAKLTKFTDLRLGMNQISDITPLASLTNLAYLDLKGNQISDISILPSSSLLGKGDTVVLWSNPLNAHSKDVIIPQLKAAGVTVKY